MGGRGRTVSNLLPLLFKFVVKTPPLNPIPLLIVVLATVFGPLKDTLAECNAVHADDAEPEQAHLPLLVGHSQQSHAERGLADCLPDDGADGRDVDEDVHAVVPVSI